MREYDDKTDMDLRNVTDEFVHASDLLIKSKLDLKKYFKESFYSIFLLRDQFL